VLTSTGQREADVEKASRVSVPFTANGDETRVVLVHNDSWRLNDDGKSMAHAVAHPTARSWA